MNSIDAANIPFAADVIMFIGLNTSRNEDAIDWAAFAVPFITPSAFTAFFHSTNMFFADAEVALWDIIILLAMLPNALVELSAISFWA